MSDPTAASAASDTTARAVRSRAWVRVFAGLVGLGLLWQAVQFGLSGSWPLAVLFFLLFGGVEAFAFTTVPRKASSPRGNGHAV
jgi:hypothetical protein